MNKQFNKSLLAKAVWLLRLKLVLCAALLFGVQLTMPQPTLAQDEGPCSVVQGRIGETNTFTVDESSGNDFQITCEGEFSEVDGTDFQALLTSQTNFATNRSKVIIDLSKVTGAEEAVTINTDSTKTIVIGSIAFKVETTASKNSRFEISNLKEVSISDPEEEGNVVQFDGAGTGTLDIDGSNLVGNIMFTAQDDVLNIKNNVMIDGGIKFEAGNDTMDIDLDDGRRFEVTKDITGLTTLTKRGKGYARFGGNVEFEPNNANAALNLREGAIVIVKEMNVGTGTVTVHKPGKVVFEIGKGGSTGKIIAAKMEFNDVKAEEVSVYAQLNDDLTTVQITAANTELTDTDNTHQLLQVTAITSEIDGTSTDVESLSIKTVDVDGKTAKVGSIAYESGVGTATFEEDKVDQIAKLNPDPPEKKTTPATTTAAGGDDNDNDVLLGLGLVAVLIALYWGDGLFGGSSFADEYAFNTPQSAYYASIDDRNRLTIRESGNQPYQVWIRTGQNETLNLAGVSSSGASGTEIGLSLYRTDDFYIEASSAQNVTAQVNALNQQAQGEVYALSSGWRNDRYFAGVKLSHGDYDFNSIMNNPVVNSALVSDSEVTHTQAQFTAGTKLSVSGLEFVPSVSIQAGSFDYSAHEAQGAALSAEVPAYTQDYSALRVGLKMSAGEWLNLSEETKWKSHLQLDQIRTDSERNGDISLRQRDKIGALSFNSGATIQAMPEVVSALSFGASVKSSKSNRGEWRFGYAGLEADGEYYHAAVAAYQMRF